MGRVCRASGALERKNGDRTDGEELLGQTLAGRYRVLRELGRGGMACVYEVDDEVAGRRVALKLLDTERVSRNEATLGQFEVEFHTLAQLAHPRVVAVYDYQKLPDSALYTMELLDGGDLVERSPIPYREACALLCDVCSALGLLHSRRLVHRDVTPRNIRCGPDGEAKLIDFGAMVPFGTHRHTVGTPPFAAPEAVTGQPLDGRADLFSLGATAYYALTGRLAFQARTFAGLRNVWRTVPPTPSRLVPGIPAELDQLVMSLLTLAPSHRPRSATEVMERLTAIAGIELPTELQTTSAYLATPTLVGRDNELRLVRRGMVRAARGRGHSILITGARGVGRSRMIDACALEGKLAGAIVLRADAQDANSDLWGGARSLLDQLATELGADAEDSIGPQAAVLASIWPGAASFLTAEEPAPPDAGQRSVLQQALLTLFSQASQQAFIVVTADDLDRMDEPSRAFIALLAGQARAHRTVVVAALDDDAMGQELKVLPRMQSVGTTLALSPLCRTGTEELLTSIFGDTPNVRLLSDRMHSVTQGNPRTVMTLAQLLLDRNVIKYQAGAWVLPGKLSERDLPSSPTAAMEQQLERLDPAQRTLAEAMALTRLPALSLSACQAIARDQGAGEVLQDLAGLMRAHVVQMEGEHYTFSHPAWSPLLVAQLNAQRAKDLHARIAEMMADDPRLSMRAPGHWLWAGEEDKAVDLLLERARSYGTTVHEPGRVAELMQAIPDGWQKVYVKGIEAAERLGRSRREILDLQLSYFGLLSLRSEPAPQLLRETLQQVSRDAGLERYAALEGKVPNDQRLRVALEETKAAADAMPEAERGYPIPEAIRTLARLEVTAIGMMGHSMDTDFLNGLPSLEPLFPLAPILSLIERNVRATQYMMQGRIALGRQEQLRLLEELNALPESDRTRSMFRYMELAITFSTGVTETVAGIGTATKRAQAIERDPLFAIAAWQLRKLAALRRGNVDAAQRCALHIERLQIQNSPAQLFEGMETWLDLRAWMEIGDVVRIRESAARVEAQIRRFVHWTPARDIAHGRIHQLRGEHDEALAAYERSIAAFAGSRSSLWVAAVRGYATALATVGRFDEARKHVEATLEATGDGADGTFVQDLHYALAVTEHLEGNHREAQQCAERALGLPEGWSPDSVLCGAIHEVYAQASIALGDQAGLARALAHCGSIFRDSRNPVLITRYERLIQDAQREGMLPEAPMGQPDSDEDGAMTTVGPVLGQSKDARQRADRVLSMIVEQGVGQTAFLYLLQGQEPSLVASCGAAAPPPHLDDLVRHVITEELEAPANDIDTQDFVTSTIDANVWANPAGEHFAPALLGHMGRNGFSVTGVIVHQTEGAGYVASALLDQLSAALTDAGDVIPRKTAA